VFRGVQECGARSTERRCGRYGEPPTDQTVQGQISAFALNAGHGTNPVTENEPDLTKIGMVDPQGVIDTLRRFRDCGHPRPETVLTPFGTRETTVGRHETEEVRREVRNEKRITRRFAAVRPLTGTVAERGIGTNQERPVCRTHRWIEAMRKLV